MHQSLALEDQLICLLSDNHYYVNIVTPSQEQLRISSDESITLIQQIPIPDSQLSHLFVLDSHLNWSVFTVSLQAATIRLQGHLDSSVLPAKIVNVHQVEDKTLLLFDDLQLYYFQMPSGNTKKFIPYGQDPEFEHGQFLIQKGYLPSPKTHRIVQSCLTPTTLYLAYEEILSQVTLIYTLKIDLELYSLLSGRICICNFSEKILGLYALGELAIAQTENQLHILNEKLESYDYRFIQKLVESKGAFYGCIADGQGTIVYKIAAKNKSIFIDKFKRVDVPILQIYPNSTDFELSFALTPKHEIIRINDPKEKKVTNIHVAISSASLNQTTTHNLLRAEKRVGAKKQTILVTNQWLTLDMQAYEHNIPLQMAKLLRSNGTACTLSSVVIGTVQFEIKKGEVNLKQSSSIEECLYCDESHWITESQISIDNKSVSVASLFENATNTIAQAFVQDGLIFLCIFDQFHAFDGKVAKITRKFIHCFNSQIKQVIKLNEVNIIGVQLYEGDPQWDSQIQIMRVGEEGLTLLREVSLLHCSEWSPFRFSVEINTASYCLNVLGPKIVICTNDSLHRYQTEKMQTMVYDLPLNQGQLFHTVKIEDTHDFLLLRWEDGKAQVFIVSVYQKYFLQSLKEQAFQSVLLLYEEVLCLTKLPPSKPIFACRWSNQKKCSNIFVMTQQHMLLLNLSLGPVTQLQSNKYLKMEIDSLFYPYQHQQFAEGMRLSTTGKDNYLLVYNDQEVHYAKKEADRLRFLSYFSLVNEEFMSFRNNLAIEQLSDQQFIALFNHKTPLKQLKWVTDRFIVVLFDFYIAILEIGGNDTLVFKHDVKMKEIKVVELLQVNGPKSIYVQDAQNRIFTLTEEGKLDFHSNLQDQIQIFGKVTEWASRGRHFNLAGMQNAGYAEELLLKRDGQLVVKMVNQTKAMYV